MPRLLRPIALLALSLGLIVPDAPAREPEKKSDEARAIAILRELHEGNWCPVFLRWR